MSNSSGDGYTVDQAKENLNVLRTVDDQVVNAIESAADEEVLEYLILDQQLDIYHEGDQGVGPRNPCVGAIDVRTEFDTCRRVIGKPASLRPVFIG